MDKTLDDAHDRWSRARHLLEERTEIALREGVDLLTALLDGLPPTGFRALVHHNIGIGHWRLVKLGYPEHAVLAADHLLQACQTDVNYMFTEGETQALERDMTTLADVVRLVGIDRTRLRAAQLFIDRNRVLLQGLPAHAELQQAVAEGHLLLMDSTTEPMEQGHCDETRVAFAHTIELLIQAEPLDQDRLGRTLANQSFVEMLAARRVAQFHHALDLAFAAEVSCGQGYLTDGPSLRARVLLCLQRSQYHELDIVDRRRLTYRLWEHWAEEWVRRLDRTDHDPLLRPPMTDWFGLLLKLECDDMPLASEYDPAGPLPLEMRQYATALVQLGGYPLGLVVVLIGYRLGGRMVPPDELFVPEWSELAREPGLMYAMTEFFAQVRDAIINSQRGHDSSLPDLVSYFNSLPANSGAEVAEYFFWACTELAKESALAGRRTDLMNFMYDLAQHVPPAAKLMLLLKGWTAFEPANLNLEHRRPAAKWSQDIVRLADVAWQTDPSVANAYQATWARLLEAKIRALVEAEDMDDVVADLRRRIEEFRSLDAVAAVALDIDFARLRTHIAQECRDWRAVLASLAECMRLMSANPALNLGSRLIAAVNLIKNINDVPTSEVRPFEEEVVAASRIILDDLPGVLALGGLGLSALGTLTEQSTVELARLEPNQVQLLTATVRARALETKATHARSASEPRATTLLGLHERSLPETLELCAHYHEQGQEERAVVELLQWILVNNGQPIHDLQDRSRQCAVAVTLEKYVSATDEFSEWVRATARYAAGESARHAGLWSVAQQYLSIAYEEARSSAQAPIPADAIECDYAALMINVSVDLDDRQEALRWLRVLFRNPLATGPLGAIHLGIAVIIFVRKFGLADVTSEVEIALRSLGNAAAVENRPKLATIRVAVVQVELHIAIGDTSSLPTLLPVLSELARGLPPSLEASIRKTKVSALVSLGDVRGLRAELDRLEFLQDEALGMTAEFDDLSYLDHLGVAHLMAAGAAVDAQDLDSAVNMLERGRLRLLQRLHAGIRAADATPNGDVEPEVANFWGQLLTTVNDTPNAAFSIAVEDWKYVFHDVGLPQALDAAERAGVVAYQFVQGDQLRMIYLLHGGSGFSVGPLDVKSYELFNDDSEELFVTLGKSWGSAIRTSISRGFASKDLSPILVSAGERPELAVLNDAAFGIASQIELGEDRLLYHLPSVRFAEPRENDRGTRTDPIQLLHVGDASNTLLGPWLEAASLRETAGLSVRSLLGGNSTNETFDHHLPDVSVIVASCHGAHSQHGLLQSSLMVGSGGLSVLDIATKRSLEHIDMLFLASCEMGRRLDEHHERESVSFSNAALVTGCRYVVAPVLPVNDLMSAVVVDEFSRRLPWQSSPVAYREALAALRTMTANDFSDRVYAMWTLLRESSLAEEMPWPLKSVDRVLRRAVARAFAPEVQLPTFCISKNGV